MPQTPRRCQRLNPCDLRKFTFVFYSFVLSMGMGYDERERKVSGFGVRCYKGTVGKKGTGAGRGGP